MLLTLTKHIIISLDFGNEFFLKIVGRAADQKHARKFMSSSNNSIDLSHRQPSIPHTIDPIKSQ